jgi:hypothetical protein
LGRLANKPLRDKRVRCHSIFDKIWRDGILTRMDAYRWLAGKLGIETGFCHFALFGENMCDKALNILLNTDIKNLDRR